MVLAEAEPCFLRKHFARGHLPTASATAPLAYLVPGECQGSARGPKADFPTMSNPVDSFGPKTVLAEAEPCFLRKHFARGHLPTASATALLAYLVPGECQGSARGPKADFPTMSNPVDSFGPKTVLAEAEPCFLRKYFARSHQSGLSRHPRECGVGEREDGGDDDGI
jgi:hypothetical protein